MGPVAAFRRIAYARGRRGAGLARTGLATAAVFAAGCRFGFDEHDAAPAGWSAPTPVPGASSPAIVEENCTMSSAGTELVFTILVGATEDLYVLTRASLTEPWSPPQELTILNSPARDSAPRFSPDDLTLYFGSPRAGGLGKDDIWASTRGAVGTPWSAPQHLADVSSGAIDKWLSPCAGGRYLMIRDSMFVEGTFGSGPPSPVPELMGGVYNSGTFLTRDCLTAYFGSDRDGIVDVFTAHRANVDAPWGPPVPFAEVNTPIAEEEDPWISPDGRLFIYSTTINGGRDVFMMTR